ncbi:phage portal protein [Oerskovia paurometabola]|uniref:phage portal protein n=1 Tax=Oerskovia paurometabola TaxID=162170 RepID=UPI00382D6BF4
MRLYERALAQLRGGEQRSTGAGLTFADLLAQFTDPASMFTSYGTMSDEERIHSNIGVYHRNGPVFALIAARLQVFSQARFQWTRGTGGNPRDMFGTKELRLLEQPWPRARTPELLGRMELGASEAGNAFVRRIRRSRSLTGGPEDRLSVLRAEWVTIIIGSQEETDSPETAADAEVVGYAYSPGGDHSRAQLFLPGEVVHYAPLPDPTAQFRGMSWITPVLDEINSDRASEMHKAKFFENAATPNLAIKFDPSITLETAKGFKEMLEGEHKGALNAYKTLYLGGGADPVVVGKDFQQLQFAATQGKGESRLASAAGVPPSWVGFSEGLQGSALNAGNFDSAARRRMGDGTMQHLWATAAATLEGLFLPGEVPSGGAMLWHDTRWVPFLRDDAEKAATTQQTQAATIKSFIDAGFTPASAVQAIDDGDLQLLEHTGLVSVQLQKPGGADRPPTAAAPDVGAADEPTSPEEDTDG